MNKKLLLIIVFLFGLFYIPIVHAEELPSSGVTYFLQYPDGTEDVTESYDKALDPDEKLIYSGTTNADGQIVLSGYIDGTVRIKENVPDGYSTNQRETIVNLSQNRSVQFTNTNGLINPQTSNTVLMIIIVLAFAITVTIITKKNQKAPLLLIPIIICTICNVKAEDNNLTITVNDSFGKPQAGITVEIYAKPYNVEASPAIKFDANGGNFFDGTTTMYFRLPNASCTEEQLIDSLDENDANYLYDNYSNSYRDGYWPVLHEMPEIIANGTTVKVDWDQDPEATLGTLYGNGGTFDFYGRTLTEIHLTGDVLNPTYEMVEQTLSNNGYHFIGYDSTSACNSYDQFGLIKLNSDGSYNEDVYACWHQKPDGVYVNDTAVFVGSDADCFNQDNIGGLNIYNLAGYNFNMYEPTGVIYINPLQYHNTNYDITKVEIVREGQTIITITADEMEYDGYYYIVKNTVNGNNLKVWYENYATMCVWTIQ